MKALLVIAPFALLGCDRADEPQPPPGVPPATQQPAPPPPPAKEPIVGPKSKPFVIDLGGHQAAQAAGCALTVRFGSIGTGTDMETRGRIEQLLKDDPAVGEIQPFVVGREGEAVLCVWLLDDSDADRLFDALRAVASDAYMVGIRTRSGREYYSPRQRL